MINSILFLSFMVYYFHDFLTTFNHNKFYIGVSMRIKRIDNIEKYILEHKSVTLDQLCENFKISKVTLRRDLDIIVSRGTIKKVYGGVVSIPSSTQDFDGLIPYEERNIKNSEEKKLVACLAAKEIQDNDIIYLDTGTSTLNLIDYFVDISNLTIITSSILVASKLLAYNNIKTIVLPGMLNTRTASLIGNSCQEYLKQCHIQKAFMACTAINESGISNSSLEEYEIKKIALKQSQKHYLLVDHTKFDKSALMTYSSLDNINHIFTDRKPDDKYIKLFKEKNIKLDYAIQ